MRLRTLVVAGAVIAVAALVVIFTPQIRTFLGGGGGGTADDEAPIYVKNGSLDITSGSPDDPNATHWKWVVDTLNDEFSHERSTPKGVKDDLYVMVSAAKEYKCSDTPPLTGKNVDIEYDDGHAPVEFTAKFRRGGNGAFSTRVKRGGLTLDPNVDWLLKHVPLTGTNHHITGIRVFGGGHQSDCSFEDDETLRIIICTDPLKCPTK